MYDHARQAQRIATDVAVQLEIATSGIDPTKAMRYLVDAQTALETALDKVRDAQRALAADISGD